MYTAVNCHCWIQIDYQNQQVAALQRQLNFVLSHVRITEQRDSATGGDGRFMSATCPRDSDKKSDNIANAANSLLRNKPPLSYSASTEYNGVSQPWQRQQTTLKESIDSRNGCLCQSINQSQTTLKEFIVTAVYVNQSIKNSRSSTVVVTGLQPSHVTSDKSLSTELGSIPSIVLTNRLCQ